MLPLLQHLQDQDQQQACMRGNPCQMLFGEFYQHRHSSSPLEKHNENPWYQISNTIFSFYIEGTIHLMKSFSACWDLLPRSMWEGENLVNGQRQGHQHYHVVVLAMVDDFMSYNSVYFYQFLLWACEEKLRQKRKNCWPQTSTSLLHPEMHVLCHWFINIDHSSQHQFNIGS